MIMIPTEMDFPKYLELKFLEWQQREGKRRTIADFSMYLGVSQSVVSMWMNGSRTPNQPSIELLSRVFGLEIYDSLGLPRPDADLHYVQSVWDELPGELRRAVREQIEQYATSHTPAAKPVKRRAAKP